MIVAKDTYRNIDQSSKMATMVERGSQQSECDRRSDNNC